MMKKTAAEEIAEIRANLNKISAVLRREMELRAKERAEDAAEFRRWREEFGNYADTESKCLEDEFADAITLAGTLNGSRVDPAHARLESKRNGVVKAEYDIVAVGEDAVFVGEIKRRLTESKVREFVKKKLPRFAKDFPATARGKKVVGMVGGAFIEKDAADAALELGMYVLRLKNNRKLEVRAPV